MSERCAPGCTCGRHKAWNKGLKCPPGCDCPKHSVSVREKLSLAAKTQDHSYKIGLKQSPETIAKRAAKNRVSRRGKRSRDVPAAGSYITKQGYRLLTGQWHPLARGGSVMEHRKVLYDKIGPGPHACTWHEFSSCGKTGLLWSDGRDGVVVDHLDNNPLNNSPDNLVPSCHLCNWNRQNPFAPWSGAVTYV